MTELYFADAKDKKFYTCSGCPEAQKKIRKCGQAGLLNFKHPKFKIGNNSLRYTFCPGKATWYEAMAVTWKQCFLAYNTGILPLSAPLHEQNALFAECYPVFVELYVELNYQRKMKDKIQLAESFLESISIMLGAKKGTRNGGNSR